MLVLRVRYRIADGCPNDIAIDLLDGYCFHRRQVFAFAVFAALLALQQHLDS